MSSANKNNIGLTADSLFVIFKDLRRYNKYSNTVLKIFGRDFSVDKAQAILIHLAKTALDDIDATDIVLASWGLVQGFEASKLNLDQRRQLYKELSPKYKKKVGTLGSDENKCYKIIAERYFELLKDEVVLNNFIERAIERYSDKKFPKLSFMAQEENDSNKPADFADSESSLKLNQKFLKLIKSKKFSIAAIILLIICIPVATLITIQNNQSTDSPSKDEKPIEELAGVPDDKLFDDFRKDIAAQSQKDVDISELEKLATAGDIEAHCKLGLIYAGNYQDEKAEKHLLIAADNGYADAASALSYLYIFKYVDAPSEDAGYKYAKIAAEHGDDFGLFLLGYCYHFNIGVEIDYKKAAEYYRQAAELGNANAQWSLGCLYLVGDEVGQNYEAAAKLFEKAHQNGCIFAAYTIGTMYENGIWFKKDIEKAVEWFLKSAECNVAKAWTARGYHFDLGEEIKQDYKEAFRCYSNAAQLGDAEGQFLLSRLYLNGYGVEKNEQIGIDWLIKSAEQGVMEAQMKIALYYFNGNYVEQDYEESAKWLRLASEQGNKEAAEYLEIMKKYGKIK